MNNVHKLIIGIGLLMHTLGCGTPVPNQIAGDGMGNIVTTAHDADRPADEIRFNGLGLPQHCQGTVGFPNPPIRPFGSLTGDLEPVDLNGDGKDDLAVTDTVNNVVSVFMGNGNGTFGVQTDYPVGLNPVAVESADLNGDGFADIVVANKNSNTISVLFGNGNGTLAPKVDYATEAGPTLVRVADLNGDGKAEIITPNKPLYATTIMFNDGNGGFAQKVDSMILGAPVDMAVIDMNNDGSLDVVSVYGTENIRVCSNNGAGTFLSCSSMSYPPFLYNVSHTEADDLDNDGRVDIIVSDGTDTYVLWNQGNGTYDRSSIWHGSDMRGFNVIDLNQDGLKDLVFGDVNVPAGFRMNQGGRSFTGVHSAVSFIKGKVANLDGHGPRGFTALVTPIDHPHAYDFDAFAAWVDLTTPSTPPMTPPIDRYTELVVGDMNSDGSPDLVSIAMLSGILQIALDNNGAGYVAMPNITMGNSPRALALADVNGDGTLDAIAGGVGTVVLPNPGNGVLNLAHAIKVNKLGAEDIVAEDLNQDGKPDIAFVNAGTNKAYVHINLGAGVFASAVAYPTGSQPREINAADLDLDGDLDLVISNQNGSPGSVTVLLNQGNGSFLTGGTYTFGMAIAHTTLGDLNGDGSIDIAASETPTLGRRVELLFNNGDGTYAPPSTLETAVYLLSLQAVDLDGDGQLDLAMGSFTTDSLVVHFNQGNGVFGSRVHYVAADGANNLVAADLNGDAKPDLVTYSNREVMVFRNTCLP